MPLKTFQNMPFKVNVFEIVGSPRLRMSARYLPERFSLEIEAISFLHMLNRMYTFCRGVRELHG